MQTFSHNQSEKKSRKKGEDRRDRLIRECPREERPQERLLVSGPESLSNAELIGLIIRSGSRNQSAVGLGQEVLNVYDGELKLFRNADPMELAANGKLRGLGIAKASQLTAAIELGRRIFQENHPEDTEHVETALEAGRYCVKKLKFDQQENFCVLLLSMRNEVIAFKRITTGTLSSSLVHPREVFLPAIRAHAAKILLSHNHRETCS